MELPRAYSWLTAEPGPRLLTEFIRVFGTAETSGPNNNPTIMGWARSVGYASIYTADEIPWCGLAMSYVAGQAGWDFTPRGNPLWALNWQYWGDAAEQQMLGDVLVFVREKGGHVAVYVGEDDSSYHVIGGNQSDKVCITRINKNRLIATRRCPWRINQPDNVRPVYLKYKGDISNNEI